MEDLSPDVRRRVVLRGLSALVATAENVTNRLVVVIVVVARTLSDKDAPELRRDPREKEN